MILLSSDGERHEDRIPEGIFSSLEKCFEWILEKYDVSFIETSSEKTDYDESAIFIYCYDEDQDKSNTEKCYFQYLIAENFPIDNI